MGPIIFINTVIILLLFYFFLASCDKCQRNNHLRKVPALLHPIPPPESSFKQFGINLVGPLQKTKPDEYRYVIVLTDYLTKWPEAEAIKNKEARTVAKFITKVVCRYSDAKVIIKDQGCEFCNAVNGQWLSSLPRLCADTAMPRSSSKTRAVSSAML